MTSLRTRRALGIMGVFVMVAAACTTPAATTAPSAPASEAPASEAPASEAPASEAPASEAPASEAPAGANEIIYAVDGDISFITNANADVPSAQATQFLFNGLYQLNADLQPAPDLAADLATVSDDGLVWDINLVENAFFADGTNMTADDVVATYEMAGSPNCRFNPDNCASVANFVESVEKTGDYSVRFTLNQKYAPFTTVVLPGVLIDSKATLDEQFAAFQEGASGASEQVTTLFGEVNKCVEDATAAQAEDPEAPSCDLTLFTAQLEEVIPAAGGELSDPATFVDAEGNPDPAGYAGDLFTRLTALNQAVTADEIDAKAAAYVYLPYQRDPNGTGPFHLVDFRPGESLTYERNEQYHFGAPTVERMFLPIIKDDVAGASALRAGQIDWKYSFTQPGFEIVQDDPNLQFAEYPDFGYFALYFNLHPASNSAGGYVPLFSTHKELRQAVAHCFNKAETVEAATNGVGVPVHSDLPPASWAYNPDLPTYAYDPTAANALLDSIGAMDSDGDGVREHPDGRPLSTKVYVRAGRPDRVAYVTLMAEQAKECGFNFIPTEGDFTNVLLKILDWPHIPPGDATPYDAYFGGFSTSLDPDSFSIYHSTECTSAEKISTFNYNCWQNEEADRLIEAGLEELDQERRTEIYQELGTIVATELPAIYAWSDLAHEGLSATFQTDALDLGSPLFFWEIHKLSNPKSAT